jgi:hypothetical protein
MDEVLMFHQSPLSLWDFTIAGEAAAPEEPVGGAGVDECGVARTAVRGVTFAVTHVPTCPPRRVFLFRALAWLVGPGLRERWA